MITQRQIDTSPLDHLYTIRNTLVVDKMKLDKFFSIFLDQYEMTEDDLDTPEWFTYREMLKHYDQITDLIKKTDYRIEHA